MKLIRKIYFLLYIYFSKKALYNKKIAISPSGYASTFFCLTFGSWLVLVYFFIVSIFDLQVFNERYGSVTYIIVYAVYWGIIDDYFDDRHIDIYNEFADSKINKKRIFTLMLSVFILPFLIIFALSFTNYLHLLPSNQK